MIVGTPVAAIRENTDKEKTNFEKHSSLNYAIEALHDTFCNEYMPLQIWNVNEDAAHVFGLSMKETSTNLHWAIFKNNTGLWNSNVNHCTCFTIKSLNKG